MTANDIFVYSLPVIQGIGPAVLVTAIVANAGMLIDVISRAIRRRGR